MNSATNGGQSTSKTGNGITREMALQIVQEATRRASEVGQPVQYGELVTDTGMPCVVILLPGVVIENNNFVPAREAV